MGRRPSRRFRYKRRAPWERPWKPRGPLLAGRMLNPRLQNEIRRANHLMAIGDHLNAAHIFEKLAAKALDLNFVYPAPMLFLQAANAFALGGDFDSSVRVGRRGLELLGAQERWSQLTFEETQFFETLESSGGTEYGQLIRDMVNNLLPEEKKPSSERASANKVLPEKCPFCGGAMDIETLDSNQRAGECQYCGSVVLARPEG